MLKFNDRKFPLQTQYFPFRKEEKQARRISIGAYPGFFQGGGGQFFCEGKIPLGAKHPTEGAKRPSLCWGVRGYPPRKMLKK